MKPTFHAWISLLVATALATGCKPHPKLAGAPAATEPAVVALSTADVLACDRRSVLYDESRHKPDRAPEPEVLAGDMRPGETGYVAGLTSDNGRVYVNRFSRVAGRPGEIRTAMVRRVTDGFLADCDSPELWVFVNEGASYRVGREDLIPVVGHIDVKARKDLK
jgi:hypothetical protein